MDKIEQAINLLRGCGYHVFSRSGYKPGVVYLIRFHKNSGGVSYNVRLSKKGNKDHFYGDRSEIAEIKLSTLKFKPMNRKKIL